MLAIKFSLPFAFLSHWLIERRPYTIRYVGEKTEKLFPTPVHFDDLRFFLVKGR